MTATCPSSRNRSRTLLIGDPPSSRSRDCGIAPGRPGRAILEPVLAGTSGPALPGDARHAVRQDALGPDRPLHDHLRRLPRRWQPRDVPRVPGPGVPRGLRRVARPVQEPVPRPARHRPPHPQLGRRAPPVRPGGRRRGRRGRVPQYRPAVLPELRPVRAAADARRVRAPARGHRARDNRWLVDFCAAYPERRAGIGQIFLNDVDDAMDDVRWIKEHGLRGGILLPNIPPDVKWVAPLYDPVYDPLWELCEELEIPVNAHGGTGSPDYGTSPTAALLQISETAFYSQRPFVQFILSGVFERFPQLEFVMTEMGCAWIPPRYSRSSTA